MNENYYALIIAIVCNCSPEQAFDALRIGRMKRRKLGLKDNEEMAQLSESHSYKEVAVMYGISNIAAYHRIRRAKARAIA